MEVILANPRGFCAGVIRAIQTVRLALKEYGVPIYVLHEIVHNRHVILELEDLGAVFVERLSDIPRRAVTIFSAHGVSREVERRAADLELGIIDSTCPLVAKVHRTIENYYRQGYDVVIIGHHGHPEVEGTAGRDDGPVHIVATPEEVEAIQVRDPGRVAYVTQTTLSQDDLTGVREALQKRFPGIRGPSSNVCYATQNRQDAVKALAKDVDLIFVVGSKNSSNSNRLHEVGIRHGAASYLIDDASDIDPACLNGVRRVGLTAGASAPERLVEGVIQRLRDHGATTFYEMEGKEEKMYFRPPRINVTVQRVRAAAEHRPTAIATSHNRLSTDALEA